MPGIALGYGSGSLVLHPPVGLTVDLLVAMEAAVQACCWLQVACSLDRPLCGVTLSDLARAQRLAIVVSDKTRPVPYPAILPPLLERLHGAGVSPSRLLFLVGTGAHGPMTAEEMRRMLPTQVGQDYTVISHDAFDRQALRFVGTTSRGTPVWVNRHYLQCDARLVIGNVEPHQFAGWSGGAKGVVVGLGGADTIATNHALMCHPQAQLGHSTGNPVWEDLAEAGRLIGIDFAVNVVLDKHCQVAGAFAGSVREVHSRAIHLCQQMAQVEFQRPADIAVASPGGYPKDINFYQSQKALGHAARAVRDGGTVILVAECREGLGDERFREWMAQASSPQGILARFRQEGFHLGAHKAFLVARDLARLDVLLCSALPSSEVDILMMQRLPSLEAALEKALARHGPQANLTVMPRAASIIPVAHRSHPAG